VENLTYIQIKEMIQRWESIKALRLNEKGNNDKGKTVEEKEKSGMETALNAFERGGRGRESRGRGGRGGRVEANSTQTPNTTQSKPQPSSTTTQHNSTNPHHLNKQNQTR
jgi:hypothetical protein